MYLSMAGTKWLQNDPTFQFSSLILNKSTHPWEQMEIKTVLVSVTSHFLLKIMRIQDPFMRV